MSQHEVTLLLGSNLGDVEKNIETALRFIELGIGPVVKKSEVLFTKPVEFASNNIFCNIVVLIKTQFSPVYLLNFIKKIEVDMGRKEDSSITNIYKDRIIDIDIVFYGNLKFECKTLQIPHRKHLYEREFSQYLLRSILTH